MTKESHTSRRDLLQAAVGGGVASILGGCKPAGPEGPSATAQTSGDNVVLSQEDSAKLLASEGSLVVEPKGAGGKIVVVHGSDGSLHAVGAACTHMGCPVEYDKGLGGFRCPCHGSEFGLDGHVIKGPATRPLKTCGVRVEDGLVTLSLPLA